MHCWRVSIRRRGMKIVKNFTDSVWGGNNEALVAAKKYRDEILRAIPPLTKLEYANLKRKNNTSGAVGVQRVKKGKYFSWVACLHLPNGKVISTSFSEKEHGAEHAQTLAIRERRKMLRQIDGAQCFVPMHEKVQKTVNLKRPADTCIRLPQLLSVRVARYVSPKGVIQLQIRVSNGIEIKTKTFTESFYGTQKAYFLVLQTAGAWVETLAGAKVRRLFENHPTCKLEQLSEDGIRFKIRLTEKFVVKK